MFFIGKWEEADGAIKEAAEKDPNFADTLINQVTVSFPPKKTDLSLFERRPK